MFSVFRNILRKISVLGPCLFLVSYTIGSPIGGATPAQAQSKDDRTQRIAAVVNDIPISQKDMRERVRLLIATSQLSDTPDVRRQLVSRAVRDLIDEQLKYQAMEKVGITVSDSDIQAAKRQIEQNNGLAVGTLGALLKKGGVREASLEKQIRANIGWVRYAQTILRQQVSVDTKEVQAFLDSLREDLKHPQRLLAEIVLPVQKSADEPKARDFAAQLVQQMRQGTPFAVLARQFSASATAAVGGDLGWVKKGSMPRAVEKTLEGMAPGGLSSPIRTPNGYSLILFRDVRQPQRLPADEVRLKIDQAFIPETGEGAPTPEQEKSIVSRLKAEAKVCGDVVRLAAKELGDLQGPRTLYKSGVHEDVFLTDFPAAVQRVLQKAPPRRVQDPLNVEGGSLVFMVCQRQDFAGLPSYQDVENRLGLQKMERVSQRALQDLRREAVIDIRL